MVTLYRGEGWRLSVYGREHGMPHFHVEGPGYRCSLSISTGGLIIGRAPASVLKAARAWALNNQDLLRQKWRELNG